MASNNQSRARFKAQHIVTIVLLLAVVALLGWLSTRYVLYADWTANHRNTLTAPSRRLVSHMKGPIKVTVFAYPNQHIRQQIRQLFQRYQRVKSNISLEFVNPAKQPKRVRRLHINASGEVLIRYQGRTQRLQALNEQTVTNALARLSSSGTTHIVFLTGNGGRSLQDTGQAGYSQLATDLLQAGLKVKTLNLVKTPVIPPDTSVLVLASPQKKLFPGEVKQIRNYVKHGGNLLWLEDPQYAKGLKPLARQLGITWQHGVIVYPDYRALGTGNPGFVLITNYANQAITKNLHNLTLFPIAQAVKANKHSGWKSISLLETLRRSYLETGTGKKAAGFQPKQGDIAGPLNVGLALTRKQPSQAGSKKADKKQSAAKTASAAKASGGKRSRTQQRVVVVGDSDFMSNGYLNTLANKDLAINMFQWLGENDRQISVQVPKAPDTHLYLRPMQVEAIWAFFVIALPLGLIIAGVGRWWVRRRR